MTAGDDTLIQLEGVHKSFGDQHILRGLSFGVRRGQCLGVMGGSGSGKSVTLRHVIGLLQPDQGSVIVDGQDLAQASEQELAALRRRMGYVFQESALINWLTVAENLALPLEETTELTSAEIAERVDHTLGLVYIPDAAQKFPAQISGGMKKRVGLARALITQPEIVLYDEPNAGLDPKIARSINELIRELSDTLDVTSLVVEHRTDCLRAVADEVIFMHEGVALVRAPIETFFQPEEPLLKEFLGT